MCPHGAYVSAVATKARHLKTPLQLWIADERKARGETPGDLARLTGVTEDTARGWESRGAPSEDALAVLERHFGKPAPRERGAVGSGGDVAAAIDRQSEIMRELVEELRQARLDRALLNELQAQVQELHFRVVEGPAAADRDLDELQAEAEATMSRRPTRDRPATAGGSGSMRAVPGG